MDNNKKSAAMMVYAPSVNDEIICRPVRGEVICFGQYDWRALEVRGSKVLILSDRIIENKPYSETWADVTWETCSLRQYLNGAFLDNFSSQEQAHIASTRVTTNNNPWYGTAGGNTTTDKVFLLSVEEVVEYFGDSGQIIHRPKKNAYWIDDKYNETRIALNDSNGASWWWLRSPGLFGFNVVSVSPDGWLSIDGHNVDNYGSGVRPCLWLNIEI